MGGHFKRYLSFSATTLLALLFSCSSTNTLDQQLAYLQEKEGISPIRVDFPIIPIRFPNSLASSSTPTEKGLEEEWSEEKIASASHNESPYQHYSNRKLYFMILWQQYLALKSFIPGDDLPHSLGACPYFRSELFEAQSIQLPSSTKGSIGNHSAIDSQNGELLAIYPELALPVALDNNGPKVADLLHSTKKKPLGELLTKAFDYHLVRTYAELNQLCYQGNSSNSYIFENLITYMREHQNVRNSTESLQILLKTPLYTNFLLLLSLRLEFTPQVEGQKTHTEALFSLQIAQEMVKRLDAEWSTLYFKELERKRVALKVGKF